MTVEAARQALFGDALASEEVRPAAVLPVPADENRRRHLLMRAEALLRALAVLEETRADDTDDRNAADPALHRLEAKVDLLLSLVGSLLLRDQPADPPRLLQWSSRGAALDVPAVEPGLVPGASALLRVQPSDALPEAVQLPAQVLAIEPSPAGRRVWLAFDALPPTLEALLQRHLFRVHRRAIAESRRTR
ncbi:PilZ domain-containing protein [Lysobacter sp. N42]|uniref:PilZ domain-containing protein n=1 Tax=Lysobacter sp. N42 TaxID=2545719 RepID=UPI0014051B66|nr:PilZ domain-containing protein [Lysobacter sp. N42]